MQVPCVNYYDDTQPPPCKYSAKRIPTVGVPLNLDPEFLCGCDCEDDCSVSVHTKPYDARISATIPQSDSQDKTKCQCWKLTLDGAQFGNPNVAPENVGYEYKRLPEAVPTGIYECNSRCRCNQTCLNRVAQQPLQMKLQVFKTGNRGWGLRCLNDIPKGSFVCVYAGNMLTEQNANEAEDGDEYFADLDYIEVAETLKEGYETDVPNDTDFDDDDYHDDDVVNGSRSSRDNRNDDDEDSGDEEFVAKKLLNMDARRTGYNTRKRQPQATGGGQQQMTSRSNNYDEDDDSDERQPISFLPNAGTPNSQQSSQNKHRPTRKLFGKNENIYIMDAKHTGNIGRYFNVRVRYVSFNLNSS